MNGYDLIAVITVALMVDRMWANHCNTRRFIRFTDEITPKVQPRKEYPADRDVL